MNSHAHRPVVSRAARPARCLRLPALLLAALVPAAAATSGEPLAVRWWGERAVSIETSWGLSVAIDRAAGGTAAAPDVLVATGGGAGSLVQPTVRLVDAATAIRGTMLVLDRRPNEPAPTVESAAAAVVRSSNAVLIRTTSHDGAVLVGIDVDGVRIVHAGTLAGPMPDDVRRRFGPIDVLLVQPGDGAVALIRSVAPRYAVPLGDGTELASAMPAPWMAKEAVGNTLAVRALRPTESVRPMLVRLRDEPWTMPAELAALFDAKEKSAAASADVFRPLSAAQMNHRPANGTHTPRWNVEHMAGRELGFFSSIYERRDLMVPHLDRNPAQMPEAYVAAEPSWTGAEEARRIERVQALTRRFAYLLDGADLDVLPEGAPRFMRSLRGLLEIMANHWGEHTANVREKFDEPDWPGGT